jgi:hypothetical protein
MDDKPKAKILRHRKEENNPKIKANLLEVQIRQAIQKYILSLISVIVKQR